MNSKYILLVLLILNVGISFSNPLWLRYPSIAPDGEKIAFTYKGDIYLLSTNGGTAIQITQHISYDYAPIWSLDGSKLAFTSYRNGNADVYLYNLLSNEFTRMTFHSSDEVAMFFSPDGNNIYYKAVIQDSYNNAQFPNDVLPEVYCVSVNSFKTKQFLSIPAEDATINKDGNIILYHDRKGYEDIWRKHHISSVTRDIWKYEIDSNRFTRLTKYTGEDRNPVFSNNSDGFYYLSEELGSFNVFYQSFSGNEDALMLTNFENHPVRFLSISNNETLCFSYNGEIYVKDKNNDTKKIEVNIPVKDEKYNQVVFGEIDENPTEIELSPDGKEIAFIIHGEIFVTDINGNYVKQITHTPQLERSVSFHPSGRKLLYASERNGSWNIYQSEIVEEGERSFYYSTLVKEKIVVKNEKTTFQPAYSPDGNKIAYLEDRTNLKVYDLQTQKSTLILDGFNRYSYADGDQWFQWSPDGNNFLITSENNLFLSNIGLVDATGKQDFIDLSQSGYNDVHPKWMLDGKMIIWFSDKYSMKKDIAWWGAQADVMGLYINSEVEKYYTNIHNKREFANIIEKDNLSEEFDFSNTNSRLHKLTTQSEILTDAIVALDGTKLYYSTKSLYGYQVWCNNLISKTHKCVYKNNSGDISMKMWKNVKDGSKLILSPEEDFLLFFQNGNIVKIDLSTMENTIIPVSIKMERNFIAEREYIFNHVWKQVYDKFYNTNHHEVDWGFYKNEYEKFLPHINNNFDFSEMLSEMLGEINGSHTGCRYKHKMEGADNTAELGVFYDDQFNEKGLRIIEVIENGPLANTNKNIVPGTILQKIDTIELDTNEAIHKYLNNKAGTNVHLEFYNPETKTKWSEVVQPIDYKKLEQLLYKRWISKQQVRTDQLSGGRIGYVHVKGMSDDSYREVYSDLMGKYKDKEAVIIDTRFNGGGWLHDDLVTLLSGEKYFEFEVQGQHFGFEPIMKWKKSSIVLISEGNYSDANGFPFAYKTLGLGKLVGMPVPGTMTAVWWERQIDNSLTFGIPQVGIKSLDGKYLENTQLEPNIKIENEPAELLNGRDQQLEKAVEVLLKELE